MPTLRGRLPALALPAPHAPAFLALATVLAVVVAVAVAAPRAEAVDAGVAPQCLGERSVGAACVLPDGGVGRCAVTARGRLRSPPYTPRVWVGCVAAPRPGDAGRAPLRDGRR